MADEELRFRAVGEDVSAGRMMDKLARGADHASKEVKDLNRDFKNLDDQLGATETSLKGLLHEFAQTGDRTLFRDIRKDRSTINMLKSVRKELTGGDAKGLGQSVGKAFGDGIGAALGALPSQLKGFGIVAGAVIGLALTPMIGATVGAAVLGGVGAGGIAGGIAAAAQDPRVRAAGTRLGDSLAADFKEIGKPFIEPLIEQMGRLEAIGSGFFSNLSDDIAPLAGHLDELVDGVAGFSENLDFGAAVDAAGPLLDVLGDKLPDLGDAITDMFESIAEESDGTALALGDVLDVTGELIMDLGELIGWLSSTYQSMRELGEVADDLVDDFKSSGGEAAWPWLIPFVELVDGATVGMDEMGEGVTKTSTRLHGLRDAAEDSAEGLQDLSDAIDTAFGKQMTFDEAVAAYKRGIRELTAELKEGKRTLDENTEAGQDNSDNVRDWLQNIEDLRVATIKQGGDVKAANATYEAQVTALKNVLIKLGFAKTEVDNLVAAYKKLPTRIEIDLILKASTLPSKQALEHALEGRASGGPVKAGQTYVVGENGPEIVTFGADGMVHNAAQSAAMMSGASGGSSMGGVSEVRASLEITGAEDEFVRMIRKIVKVRGGGIVQTAFGT